MKSTIRRLAALVVIGTAAVALVACGGDDDESNDDATASATASDTTTATAEPDISETTVEFTLTDFAIAGPTSAPAGAIQFEVKNEGLQLHELVIVRSDEAPDALPVVDAIVPEDDLDIVGRVDQFPGGEERTATFELEAGNYLLICNIPAHYELGMVSAFTVE